MLHLEYIECYHIYVQIRTGLTPKYLLDALHTGGTFGNYRGQNGANDPWLIRASAETYATAQIRVRDLLRQYLDEWLDTGFNNGIEEPQDRKLQDTKTAYPAVQRYCEKYRPQIMVADAGLFALFGSPSHASGGRFESGPSGGRMVATDDDPLGEAADEAARIFTLLVDAPWRERVYKCRKCHEYRYLSRKPVPIYKRGMYCPKCRSLVTAVASAKSKRAERFGRTLQAAAAAWRAWKPRYGARKAWVVSMVNSTRRNEDDFIKANWVTRHQNEIEEVAKERT